MAHKKTPVAPLKTPGKGTLVRDLHSPKYHQRKVHNKKVYDRKKHKEEEHEV